jgi:hypothetical protein
VGGDHHIALQALVRAESGIRDGLGELPAVEDFSEFIKQRTTGKE